MLPWSDPGKHSQILQNGLFFRPLGEAPVDYLLRFGSDFFFRSKGSHCDPLLDTRVAKRSFSTLEKLFAKGENAAIAQAYREHGYRLQEIATHLGVHYATVNRKLKKIERRI